MSFARDTFLNQGRPLRIRQDAMIGKGYYVLKAIPCGDNPTWIHWLSYRSHFTANLVPS